MVNLRRVFAACVIAVLMLGTVAIAASDTLEKGFVKPPDSAKPHTWWHWMNGNISREGITADLEAMKRVGLGGAQIFNVDCGIPAGPVKVMSPEWIQLVKHAVTEADRLGLELCMHNCGGWSSSGGPWIKPEQAMQEATWSVRKVDGPVHFTEVLPQPEKRAGFYRDVAVLAFRSDLLPDGEQIGDIRGKAAFDRRDRMDPDAKSDNGPAIPLDGIVDISSKMTTDGKLTWDVPTGKWTILRMGYTPTGAINAPAPSEATGLECDKFSKEGIEASWAGMMGPVIKSLGPEKKALHDCLIDSYERGHQNWSATFPQEFAKRRGYDIKPYMPVLTGRIVGSAEVSERFLWDFRRTVAELWAENYVGHFSEICHKNGMISSIEPYGNASFDNIETGSEADIVMGEFWVGDRRAADCTKMAASAVHTKGGTICGAESFTAVESRGKWQVDPYAIKVLGDQVYCAGVNRFIMHRYAHQPWLNVEPGMTMGPWGTNFERTITWWEQSKAWLSYLSRCQFLLQSGLFSADVCYYYGEAGANDLPDRHGLRPVLPEGYDYDGCDAEAVMRMNVKNGRVVLPNGMNYKVLVLPQSRFMTPRILEKVACLVKAGAVVVGPKPTLSPSLSDYPTCDERVRKMADEVWGDCDGVNVKEHKYGLGRVVDGVEMGDLLAGMKIRQDFSASKAPIGWIHRKAGDADIYFVANQTYAQMSANCKFRQSGKVPELWNPDTGKMMDAAVYTQKDGLTTVPIQFDPAGSVFVVFKKAAGKADHLVSVARIGEDKINNTPNVKIVKAIYGAANDPAHTADVTEAVASMVAHNQMSIAATNDNFGDPAQNIVKQLTMDYVVNGKAHSVTVGEGDQINLVDGARVTMPQYEVVTDKHGAELKPWKSGTYVLKAADGKTRRLQVKSDAVARKITGPWTLRFPKGWGAPKQVVLNKLISWTEHKDAGVRYFSGTAEYVKDFDLPASMVGKDQSVLLDLGKVKNFAEVTLNGKKLGVLWKEPFRVDVTGLVRAGRNHLEVSVTNLWPNRLIGDAQCPDDCQWNGNTIAKIPQWVTDGGKRPDDGRYAFTTWRLYDKDSQLLESGLIGPVVVRSVKTIRVK